MSTSRFNFTITFIATCLYILLLSSCIKDPYKNGEPSLPPITMEGKNTLGFLLDGKVWVPYVKNPSLFKLPLEVHLDNVTNTLMITGLYGKSSRNIETDHLNINFTLKKNKEEYSIPKEATIEFYYHKFPLCIGLFECISEKAKIELLKFDTKKRVVSGTFHLGKMVNSCGDTIQITDGRFDVKY